MTSMRARNEKDRANEFILDVSEMVRSSGVDVIPREILGQLAAKHGLSRMVATCLFIDASWALHVEEWQLGLTTDQYRSEYAKRAGAVNIWAAVVQTLPATHEGAAK